MVELVVPLLAGLVSAGLVAVVWRTWTSLRNKPDGRRPVPLVRSSAPTIVGVSEPLTVVPTERMRARPLAAVGAQRALPESTRTTGVCPVCARTLEPGVRRCSRCRTRLVGGVPLRRAAAFAVRGAVLGLLAGLIGGIVIGSRLDVDAPAAAAMAGVSVPTPMPAPAGVRAALDSAIAVHGRLAAAREALETAMRSSPPDVAGIGGELQAIDADAAEGVTLAAVIQRWQGSADLGVDLREFHAAVRRSAASGIGGDAPAVREAGAAVLQALDRLAAVDWRTKTLSREVAPLATPAAGGSSGGG